MSTTRTDMEEALYQMAHNGPRGVHLAQAEVVAVLAALYPPPAPNFRQQLIDRAISEISAQMEAEIGLAIAAHGGSEWTMAEKLQRTTVGQTAWPKTLYINGVPALEVWPIQKETADGYAITLKQDYRRLYK